jgi:hypothetical protein
MIQSNRLGGGAAAAQTLDKESHPWTVINQIMLKGFQNLYFH